MYGYTPIQWLFFFYFYCFFGWCFESVYVTLKSRHWTNRGFMRGPFLPLYGSGAIMMLIVSAPFQEMAPPFRFIAIFVAGCIGATALEYITGVIMEALFKVRYWDYSQNRFNFQGHICLGASLAWGFLTIFMTQFLHKPVEGLVFGIPSQVLTVATLLLTAFLCADFALSFKAALDLKDVLVKLERVKEELARMQKRLDVMIAMANEGLENYREELSELRAKYSNILWERENLFKLKDFFQRDLIRSNPTMSSKRFKEALEELKTRVQEKRRK